MAGRQRVGSRPTMPLGEYPSSRSPHTRWPAIARRRWKWVAKITIPSQSKSRVCLARLRLCSSRSAVETERRCRFFGKERSPLQAPGESPLSAKASDKGVNNAVTAYLKQEVQAPAAAVSDFLDIIIEDARSLKLDHVLADLERMRCASMQLTMFVKSVTADGSSARGQGENLEAFQRRLRHDLRSPLNVIKGYSELLIEDLEADDNRPLREDLTKLRDSADQLLAQIDAIVSLTLSGQTPRESRAQQVGFVEDVLRTVQPL